MLVEGHRSAVCAYAYVLWPNYCVQFDADVFYGAKQKSILMTMRMTPERNQL